MYIQQADASIFEPGWFAVCDEVHPQLALNLYETTRMHLDINGLLRLGNMQDQVSM